MAISAITVRRHLGRARKRLREILADDAVLGRDVGQLDHRGPDVEHVAVEHGFFEVREGDFAVRRHEREQGVHVQRNGIGRGARIRGPRDEGHSGFRESPSSRSGSWSTVRIVG